MMWFIILLAAFLLLLLLPLGWSAIWYYRSKDSVLPVRQERRRDPRYFAKSFEKKFEEAWAERKDGKIKMSREEKYLLVEATNLKMLDEDCNKMLVALNKDIQLPAQVKFQREIYSGRSLITEENSFLRAARVKGNVILGRGTVLDRWVDADGTVAAYEDCNLGISITSGTAISVGENCFFRRLYAPVIHLGAYPGDNVSPAVARDEKIYGNETTERLAKNKRRINSDQLNDEGMVGTCIVTDTKIVIEENIIVQGDIHTRKSIHLADGAVVCGNIFAGKHVYLDKHSTVLGSVFSQGNIVMSEGVVIGQEGRTSSVIARSKIKTAKDCLVYGYISNEGGGVAYPINKQDRANQNRPVHEETFLTWPKPRTELRFTSLENYNRVDSQGFRHYHSLELVTIPEGVERIQDSMFFDCSGLKQLSLPATLTEIGEYAFADCKSLTELDLSHLPLLRRIDRSAFDGCTGLRRVKLPAGIRVLGPAVFFGCTALEEIQVPPTAQIAAIGSHCFMHCPLEQVPTVTVPPVVAEAAEKAAQAAKPQEGEVTVG